LSSSRIAEDQAIISLVFEDGSIGNVVYAAGDTALPKERCEVFGDGTSIVLEDFVKTTCYRGGRRQLHKTRKRDKGFAQEMACFFDAVMGKGGQVPAFDDIYTVTRAALLADRSLRTGQRYALQTSLPR
jgi:predicted dehydrogenase